MNASEHLTTNDNVKRKYMVGMVTLMIIDDNACLHHIQTARKYHPSTLHLIAFSQRHCLAILPPLQGLAGSSKATSRKRTGAALPLIQLASYNF